MKFNAPSDTSLTLWRTMATKMTSIRKTMVVSKAAKSPVPSLRRWISLDTSPSRLRMMKEVTNARKVRAHAVEEACEYWVFNF